MDVRRNVLKFLSAISNISSLSKRHLMRVMEAELAHSTKECTWSSIVNQVCAASTKRFSKINTSRERFYFSKFFATRISLTTWMLLSQRRVPRS